MDMTTELLDVRRATYARLRGGYPVILAGMIYWLALAALSPFMEPIALLQAAFPLSGAIFLLALVLAWITRNSFMKDRTALSPVLLPTFIAMLLFWPMLLIAAAEASPGVVMSILAIGLSLHWPVIGWTYGRTALYCGHAIARAMLVLWIFHAYPDQRMLLIPLAVAACYGVTAIIVFIDSAMAARRLGLMSDAKGVARPRPKPRNRADRCGCVLRTDGSAPLPRAR